MTNLRCTCEICSPPSRYQWINDALKPLDWLLIPALVFVVGYAAAAWWLW